MLFSLLLFLHIAGGGIGLVTGTIVMILKKGDKYHKAIGKIFVYSMLVAGFFSLVLCIIHPNQFLFIVGIFTIYLVTTGNRYIYLKMLGGDQKPKILDWFNSIAMFFAAIAFIYLGVKNILSLNNFGFVFIVFGLLGFLFIRTDFKNYTGKIRAKNYWLLAHLQRMIGGYISALTAFFVVNSKHISIIHPILIWLMPGMVLTPLIIYWSRKYKVSKDFKKEII